jgi:hypothetical protein
MVEFLAMMLSRIKPAGATAMRWLIALFIVALVATVTAGVGYAFWEGRLGLHEPAMRPIHYDSRYDLSSQRRTNVGRLFSGPEHRP